MLDKTFFKAVLRDIVLGKFNYNQCFDSFIAATTQKRDTALLLSNIVNGLKESGLISQDNQQLMRIADIGCANAASSILFLQEINHPGGYSYRGIDISKGYIEEAQNKLSLNSFIKNYSVTEGDALCGNLADNSVFSQEKFDLILVSHVAYYIQSDEVKYKRFINDLEKLLAENGVIFFMHGNSHEYLLSNYSKDSSNNSTPYVNTPSFLEQCSKKLAFESTSIDFVSKLHFAMLDDRLWTSMEKTENYKSLQNNNELMSNLEKLSMVINRDLSELEEEGKLLEFIRDAKNIIIKNGGFFYLHTHFQVMLSSKNSISLQSVTEILQAALNKNPELIIEGSQLMTLNQIKTRNDCTL